MGIIFIPGAGNSPSKIQHNCKTNYRTPIVRTDPQHFIGRGTSRGHPVLFFFPLIRMPPPVLLLLQFLLAASAALGQNWKADPFIPPAIPLAVKSPYLQIWSQQRKLRGPLDGMELSWTGMIRVDDSDFFEWMGFYVNVVQKDLIVRTPRLAWTLLDTKWTLNASKVTSTKTIVTVACGSVDVTATFLNPIEVCVFNLQADCDLT